MACITAGDYQMSVTEFTDDDLLTELETITVQMAPSECLVPQADNEDVSFEREHVPDNLSNIQRVIVKARNLSSQGREVSRAFQCIDISEAVLKDSGAVSDAFHIEVNRDGATAAAR